MRGFGFVEIKHLHPTQHHIGQLEVDRKLENFEDKSKVERREYILTHAIPVVYRGNGQYYILDHHHLARALLKFGKERLFVKVVAKITTQNEREFWREMARRKLICPFDENFKFTRSAENGQNMPDQIDEMKDDPYRSLAGRVRDLEGFTKDEDDYYIDFMWADFFRTRIKIGTSEKDFEKAVQEAHALALTPEAAEMPGFVGKCEKVLKP